MGEARRRRKNDHPLVQICPQCGANHDGAANLPGEDASPAPGDITLCIVCGALNLFDERMVLRVPTETEAFEMEQNQDVQAARTAWRRMVAEMGLPTRPGSKAQ